VPIRHTDGLGFSDVTTLLTPPPALIRFFGKTLPAYAETFRARFEEHRTLLWHYAIDLGLEQDTHASNRKKIYEQFRRELSAGFDPNILEGDI
jgi:hypothetical protein